MLLGKELERTWRGSGFDVVLTNILEGVRGIVEDVLMVIGLEDETRRAP